MQKNTVKERIVIYSKSTKWFVVFRDELKSLGSQRQISRALNDLVAEGFFIKIGHGLYAKTKVAIINGSIIPQNPLPKLAREVLRRLGVETFPTLFEKFKYHQ
jgi:hypothetical protein